MITDQTQQETYICPRCDAVFETEEGMTAHLKSHVTSPHGAQFTCLECGASFLSETELNEHAKTHEDSAVSRDRAA